MDLSELKLNRMERQILFALWRYNYADIAQPELNGYLRFPPWENILSALGTLRRAGLIENREPPFHGYQLTPLGEQYRRKRKQQDTLKTVALGVLSSLIAAAIWAFFKLP